VLKAPRESLCRVRKKHRLNVREPLHKPLQQKGIRQYVIYDGNFSYRIRHELGLFVAEMVALILARVSSQCDCE
jgi:hypothetical protein